MKYFFQIILTHLKAKFITLSMNKTSLNRFKSFQASTHSETETDDAAHSLLHTAYLKTLNGRRSRCRGRLM